MLALAYAAAWELRQLYIEPSAVALVCNAASHPSWCAIRFAILFAQREALFGIAAVVMGGVALLCGGPKAAIAAIALSALAIANYNVEMGALALVAGLIASVGRGRRRLPGEGAAQA